MRSAPRRLALLAIFALSAGLAGPLWAATGNVSNLSLSASDGELITQDYPAAQAFTVSTTSAGSALQSVTLPLSVQNQDDVTVALYSVSSGDPGTSLTTLSISSKPTGSTFTEYAYTCSSNCQLTAGYSYFIVLTPGNVGIFRWSQNTSGTEVNTPENAGWSIADDAKYRNGSGGNWTDEGAVKLMKVSWVTKPGKVASLTAAAGNETSIDLSWTATASATGYKVQYRSGEQDWSTTRQFTPTTNSQNIAKNYLTANTAYTFRVAATNAAGDGAWSDEVVATPVNATLRASSIEASSATLTLANHSGTWYYKQVTPTAGTCSSRVSSRSDEGRLSPGLTHTFSAYTDDQCTGTVLATTPPFLAKPGKAAGVAATAAAAALDVSWTATTGASSYKIQWKSSSDSGWDAANRQTTSTTASATISSLTNGTTYTVRVAAVNDTGDGAWSDTATGTPSGSTLRLVTAAANGGVLALSGHTGTWYSKVTPPANATCETNNSLGKTVADKSSATSYTITAYSDSSCNTQLTSLAFTTLPAKVAGVTATARKASLGVGWTAESGTAPVSYKVQWKSGAENWDETSRQVVTSKTRAALSGLTNGTQYTIRVAATTASGDGAWSDDATGTPSAAAVTLEVGGVNAVLGQLRLSNHSGDWWYSPDRGDQRGQCISGPSGGSAFVVYGDSGTEITVTAYSNSSCTTALTSIDFLLLPGKTTGVTLTNTGASLRVGWTAETGADSYKVQWKSGNESFGSAREITATTTPATIPSLTNNTAYSVRVAAVNASGDGAWSDTVRGAPSVLLIGSNLTSTSVTLTVAGWSGNWYLSGRGSGGYSLACTRISGITHSPALSGNTTYEYKAYDTDRCTGRELASATFTTPGAITLFADNIKQHSATLYLDGWESLPKAALSFIGGEAGSSYSDRRCSDLKNPSFATHVEYGSLKSGTTYTVQYFRGRGCAAIEQLASVTFTTLSEAASPELSVSNVTNTGATLTLANHTGNWWYENDDVADSCTAVTGGATTEHLSGLTANTNYGFTAWSHAGCADATDPSIWYSKQAFTTTGPLTVSVSGKTSSGLTVNLRSYTQANGYPEQWSVRVVRPDGYTGSACQTLPRATTSATVTGLEAGKQYTIQIHKGSDCANVANIVNETPVTTVSLVGGDVGPSSATLTLGHHEGAWSYQGGQASGQGAGASGTGQCQSMPAGSYTAELDNLNSDTDYAYTAHVGGDCTGGKLAGTSFTTPPLPSPDAPTGLAAEGGDASVTLTWSDPSDSSITGYEYQVNHNDTDTGKLTGWSAWTAIDGAGADTTSHVVDGLTNGREYRFRLRAQNDGGAGATGPEADPWYVAATPQAPVEPIAPETPSSVTVTRGNGMLNASWPAVEGAASYHVTYSSNNGASWSLAAEDHPANSITITGVDNALAYIVGVRARNEHGDSGWINSPPAEPYSAEPPATPDSVTVTRGDGTLDASWPAVEGATSYHVTYSSDNGASWSLAALHHPETSITIEGVDNALTYIVGVRARNEHGDSGWRNSPPAEPADKSPQFGKASIGDLRLEQGKAMDPVTLPAASGGNGSLSYALSGELPAGLTFDAATRVLSGRPAQVTAPRRFEYTATDADASEPDVARLSFGITVAVSAEDKAVVEDALAAQGRAMLTGVTSVIGERFRTLSDNAREDIRPDLDLDRTTAALNTLATWLAGHAGGACQPTHSAGFPGNRLAFSSGSDPARTASAPRDRRNEARARRPLDKHLPWERGLPALDEGGDALAPRCDGPHRTGSAMHSSAGLNLGDLLRGRSFAAPLNGGRLTLWSTAGYQGFDDNQFGGGVSSLYFGADTRFGTNWLAGAALSLSRGDSAYSAPGREGSLKTRLLSLHPYVRGEMASGMQLWAIGGFGRGKAEDAIGAEFGAGAGLGTSFGVATGTDISAGVDASAGAETESARLGMTMLAAGLRQPLRTAGAFEFSLLGEAGRLSLNADEGEGYRAVDGLGIAVSQGRLAMEVAHKHNALSPYLRVGARTDGGSGLTGTGMEVAGGLRYAGEWIEFEAQARWLAAHSESSHKEYGGNARLILKSRPDGAGLRLSLSPSWGQAAGEAWLASGNGLLGGPSAGARALAGASAAGMGAGDPMASASALSLDGKLEYGLTWHRLKGLLTPMLAYTTLPTGARTLELGFAYQSRDLLPRSNLAMEFAVGHETRTLLAPPDRTARLTLSLRPGGTAAPSR